MPARISIVCPLSGKKASGAYNLAEGDPTLQLAGEDTPQPPGWGRFSLSVVTSVGALASRATEMARKRIEGATDLDDAQKAEALAQLAEAERAFANVPERKVFLTYAWDAISDDKLKAIQEALLAVGVPFAALTPDAIDTFLGEVATGAAEEDE